MDSRKTSYYLGMDIGTDSVGYAATDKDYSLVKYRGEPVWGLTTFEAASLAEDRRMNRTARRRLDRKQQRVQFLSEIFAKDICSIDPNFFIRRKESGLFAEDSQYGVRIFGSGITDKEYHKQYPTIHHLIDELMESEQPHDVRLIFLACVWLVANRGHFLLDATADEVSEFTVPYHALLSYFSQEVECALPWNDVNAEAAVQEIMQADLGVTRKKALFAEKLFGGKKPSNKADDSFPFRRDAIVTLLSGGKESPKNLFCNDAYTEIESVSLGMDEENFERIIAELGDDGALLRLMRRLYDCALLNKIRGGANSISKAKVETYKQHAEDLKWLKYFIRKYLPKSYNKVFRFAETGNYVAYSYNIKSCPDPEKVGRRAPKEDFCEYVKKLVKNVSVAAKDLAKYEDMMVRLDSCSFLPKQKDGDNRIIPQQLYRLELVEILKNARSYLPMLSEADADGITNEQKILSIFDFRIPYFVGPLNQQSPHAWLERKAGKIYPWNFDKMVDLDLSEQRFINRMTNTCTYLPGEDVLPMNSLLYSRYMVLNELNNLKINQNSIPVEVKQELYNALFEQTNKRVTLAGIKGFLQSRGHLHPGDEVNGIDTTVKSSLKSYHSFKHMLDADVLTEAQVEDIINHAAYSENKSRMIFWLEKKYPSLSEKDRKHITGLKLKEFGRLSRKLLTEILGCSKTGTGEAMSIMDALWLTNDNLMQILSDKYTFREQIEAFAQEYYADPTNKRTLSERLDDMYVSNAVKRQIIRSLDIASDVVKALGNAPEKIFIEMARGGTPDQKGKRTLSRRQQILDLYKTIKTEDVRTLSAELETMGDMADNRLQSDRLFLYYMQLGKCMYTGQPIALDQLSSKTYDIDHIYPQSKVKDDSVINNKVLVLSSANEAKKDRYPIDAPIRQSMQGYWTYLKNHGLISEEKYRRLIRPTPFTEDELRQFINRQLVETRQSTKVVAQLLKERYPDTEIVYVKAGMVSEFRQEYDMLKCRSVNDLHHAKDAYLNIVVGNVYHEKFTRRWFDVTQKYTMSTNALFTHEQYANGTSVWRGQADLARVRKNMGKNNIHVTRYAFCRHRGQNGGFFDQNPKKAGENLVPRKAGLNPAKYGGYNGLTTAFFTIVRFSEGKKSETMFFPVDLLYVSRFLSAESSALDYIRETLVQAGKKAKEVSLPLGRRILKVNTVLSLDGYLVCLTAGSIKDGRVGFLPITQFVCGYDVERYIKRLERLKEKLGQCTKYMVSEKYDEVSSVKNLDLYDLYIDKLENTIFSKRPGASANTLRKGRDAFAALPLDRQCIALLKIHKTFASQSLGIDLSDIGLSSHSFGIRKSMQLSGWVNDYHDVRIVDMSSSGLFVDRSENLLELL